MPRRSDTAIARKREKQRARNKWSQESRVRRLELRPFIAWDGEGYNAYRVSPDGIVIPEHRYMLFGNSAGFCTAGVSLSTRECLDLILTTEAEFPDAYHVGFSFEYDVNMILRDLKWRFLAVLRDAGAVLWNGYKIKHVPHKIFTVSKNGCTATIYDVFGYFHCSYVKAIGKYRIGTREQRERILAGKRRRANFTYADLPAIKQYWSEEISLMPPLMDNVRESAYLGGFFVTEWYGPGALASYALRQNKIKYCMGREKEVPNGVKVARRLAYAGGRFQDWRAGLYRGYVYSSDINSAYAYAASRLPNLASGAWQRRNPDTIRGPRDIAHFGLYHVRYDAGLHKAALAREKGIPFPLFHRDKKGNLTWPHKVDGWYWSPEAALVAGQPEAATFVEAWEFTGDSSRPFAWMEDAYERRLELIERGHPAKDAYKWALASVYGLMARRVGWNKKTRRAPRTHQLEWAGYVTSYCRAMVYMAALTAAKLGGLIMIATDGILSTKPIDPVKLPNGEGTRLGQWKLEKYDGILYWQSGFYWTLRDGEWKDPKTRGVPKGSIGVERAFDAIHESGGLKDFSKAVIKYRRTRFTGYSQALNHQYDKWQQWSTEPVEIQFGGSGKGKHVPSLCSKCLGGGEPMHRVVHFPPDDEYSHPHKLPWLEKEPMEEIAEKLIFPDLTI